MFLICGSADAFQAIATIYSPTPIVGQMLLVAAWFYGWAIWLLFLFWLKMKEVDIKWMLWGGIGELMPFLNGLPFFTMAVAAIIIKENLDLAKKLEKVAGKVMGKKDK